MNDEEQLLVERIKSGDLAEFDRLIKSYQKLVFHIVARVVPKTEDRDDLAQDVFIKVFKGLGSFKFECKLSSWIGRIAFNSALNFAAKKKLVIFSDLESGGVSADSIAIDAPSPLAQTERSDIAERLQAEIEKLPGQYRIVITLFHIDQLTYDEIADIMKLPMNTIKSHLFRARKQLKESLMLKYSQEDLCA